MHRLGRALARGRAAQLLEGQLRLVGDNPQHRILAGGVVHLGLPARQHQHVAGLPGKRLVTGLGVAGAADHIDHHPAGFEAGGQLLAGADAGIARQHQRRGGGVGRGQRGRAITGDQTGRGGGVEGACRFVGEAVRRHLGQFDVESIAGVEVERAGLRRRRRPGRTLGRQISDRCRQRWAGLGRRGLQGLGHGMLAAVA